MSLMMRVVAPHFCAGAVWEKQGRTRSRRWVCVEAAPIIAWMKDTPAVVIKTICERNGWKVEWIG